MKQDKQRRLFYLCTLLFSLAGLALRFWQNRAGFEPDTGLPISGALPNVLLPAVLIAALAALFLLSRAFPVKPAALAPWQQFDKKSWMIQVFCGFSGMVWAGAAEIRSAVYRSAGVLSADGMEFLTPGGVDRIGVITGGLALAAAGCILLGMLLICEEKEGACYPLLAAPVLLLARLIFVYRVHSVDPVLANYYLEILSLVFLILALYRLAGFTVNAEHPRLYLFYYGMASVLAFALVGDGFTSAGRLSIGCVLALPYLRTDALTAPRAAASSAESEEAKESPENPS